MELEELIKERDELFEGIKNNIKGQAKKFMMGFVVFILLAGISIHSTIYGNMSPILCTIICVCILVLLSYFMYYFNKNIKANNALDFLTFYDKQEPMMKWISIILFSLLTIAIIIHLIDKKDTFGFFVIVGMALATTFFSYLGSTAHGTREKQEDLKNDIQRLRELVQQTGIRADANEH